MRERDYKKEVIFMRFLVSQTLTFSKVIEADSEEEAKKFWCEEGADTKYNELKIRLLEKRKRSNEKRIHVLDGDETLCGLPRYGLESLDTNITGNINKITCGRCLHIVFKD